MLGVWFSQFGTVTGVTRETTVIDGNVEKRNGVRVVHLTTDQVMKGGIPHLVKYDGGVSMLVTIAGRPPLCLSCHNIGHLRRDCMATSARQESVNSYASLAAGIHRQRPTSDEPVDRETKTDEKEVDVNDGPTEQTDGEVVAEVSEIEVAVAKENIPEDVETAETTKSTHGVVRPWFQDVSDDDEDSIPPPPP